MDRKWVTMFTPRNHFTNELRLKFLQGKANAKKMLTCAGRLTHKHKLRELEAPLLTALAKKLLPK